MKDLGEFIDNIDFDLLKDQKEEILKLIDNYPNTYTKMMLDATVNMIDYIQDTAVDELGYSENEVFGIEENRTATLYKEDYSVVGWYYILHELGLIEEDYQQKLRTGPPEEVFTDEDLETYNQRSIEVTLP